MRPLLTVQVLDRMHAKATERLDIGVAVVQGMHILVQEANVQKPGKCVRQDAVTSQSPVCNVEVDITVHGHEEHPEEQLEHLLRVSHNGLSPVSAWQGEQQLSPRWTRS